MSLKDAFNQRFPRAGVKTLTTDIGSAGERHLSSGAIALKCVVSAFGSEAVSSEANAVSFKAGEGCGTWRLTTARNAATQAASSMADAAAVMHACAEADADAASTEQTMRRKDREVADLQELCRMLDACDVIHVGLCQNNVPYVVPLSFGWEAVEGHIVLWFHCAREGRKTVMLKASPRISVCASRFVRYDQTATGVTARYESVMGEGTASEAEDESSRLHGLELVLAHCGYGQIRPAGCRNLAGASVWKIVLDTVSAKRNLRRPD